MKMLRFRFIFLFFLEFVQIFSIISLLFFFFNDYGISGKHNIILYEFIYFGRNYSFCLDFLNFWFILLTLFLFSLVFLYNFNKNIKNYFWYNFLFLLLEFFLLLSLFSDNLFLFYIFFEATLLPMFLIICFWGSRERRLHAAFLLVFYTLFGSIFIFPCIFFLDFMLGTTNFFVFFSQVLFYDSIFFNPFVISEFYYDVSNLDFVKKIIWLFLFIGFMVKIPVPPLHIWLTEAHAEATTGASVILAGVILKLGGYAMVRVLFTPFFFEEYSFFLPFCIGICLLGVYHSVICILAQEDLKKIIAYSSIVHMNFGLIGFFLSDIDGLVGFIYSMLSHGLVAAGLFFLVGMLYERVGSRNVVYLRGISTKMLGFIQIFFLFSLANMAFPLTSGFIGEFMIIMSFGTKEFFPLLNIILVLSTVLNTVFNFYLLSIFYPAKTRLMDKFNFAYSLFVLSYKEISILVFLLFFIFILGCFPLVFLSIFYYNINLEYFLYTVEGFNSFFFCKK